MTTLLKSLCFLIMAALIIALACPVFAWEDSWEIRRDSYGRSNSDSTDIEMQKKNDYDPSTKYRGTIENDGYTRTRNYDGDTLRGYIDSDGYGRLHDQDGNDYRVRPGY